MTSTTFKPIEFFASNSTSFRTLPYRFQRTAKGQVLLTNMVGDFVWLTNEQFNLFTSKKLSHASEIYKVLRSKHFLSDNTSAHLNLLASEFWTKKSFLAGFTKLHIFILTLRCNCACTYCQASRQNEDASQAYDMSTETARKAVEVMMKSPSPSITVEFQGGEPLLNFSVLKEVVLYANELNESYKKDLSFVVCTNLAILDDEILDFFKKYKVSISTSVDGPAFLHDTNRARIRKNACHAIVEKNIRIAQSELGKHSVSALMTTTRASLPHAKEIIDEYLRLDLGSIFIRALNPYGYALKTQKSIGYSVSEFVSFYKECFNYIFEINKSGRVFPEAYASLLLRKILTPWTVGFVDLQSPTGNGFAVTVYNYDADVYASDESRMLFEMGDNTFRLGNLFDDSYKEIYFGSAMQLIASTGVAETLAGCSDCVYVPYCGADPIRHYATQKDPYGNRASSSFCKKNKMIFDFLFDKISNLDEKSEEVIWAWVRSCSIDELSMKG